MLKQKIEEILKAEGYTFRELSEYLKMDEQALENALEHRTLELRYLEEISKVLKVPLYSFFRTGDYAEYANEKPYYTNKLWKDEEEQNPLRLQEEIHLLRDALNRKEQELRRWTG